MKKMLFLLLLLPLISTAQRSEWDIAYEKDIPGGVGKRIHLPERDYNPNFLYEDTVSYLQKERLFVVSEDSVYRKLFWRYVYTKDSLAKYKTMKMTFYDSLEYNWMKGHLVDSLPVIDFSEKELVMFSACAQCLAFCNHDKGETSCHRNACMFRETWFVREKKKF